MMTNMRESTEFLSMYLTNIKFWIFSFAIIASIVLIRVLFLKIFSNRKSLRFAAMKFCICLGIFALGRQFYLYRSAVGLRVPNTVGVLRLANLYKTNRINMQNYEKMINDVPKQVTLTKNESSIPYIVYILGESTTRNHMRLYGYKLATNPLLSRREDSRGGG